MTATAVTLDVATETESELLGNLMELYVHDLSAIFLQVELGPDGRFGYPGLRGYVTGSGGRVAFVIRASGRVAGFVLVQRGSPFSDDPDVLDVAEFFVLRRFRGQGVGRAAAELLWDRLPGRWSVRAAVNNGDAVSFWRGVVGAYTKGAVKETARKDGGAGWVVFEFGSGGGARADVGERT
jgi:predicted acetyltransferase